MKLRFRPIIKGDSLLRNGSAMSFSVKIIKPHPKIFHA